jgi:inner membrane protein YidH
MDNLYERFKKSELILRDELAIDRTLLANERTLLAYLRSGIALLLAGLTFIQFAPGPGLKLIGVICLPVGIAILFLGTIRFSRVKSRIDIVRQQLTTLEENRPE